jgi:UrcA family protein
MTMNTTTSSTRKNLLRVLLPSLAAGYLGLCAPVSRAADAVPGYEPTAKMVQYGDLNLATAQGVERLYQRIVGAANEVCNAHGDRSLKNMARSQMCIRESIRSAVAAAGVPQLSALYASKTGQQKTGSTALAQR